MAELILQFLSRVVVDVISWGGYGGVFLLMALASANIPIPSEVVMSFVGFLSFQGAFNVWVAVAIGVAGETFGAVVSYWIGLHGGRAFIDRYGKYVLLPPEDVALAERWIHRYGAKAAFFGRLVPVVRAFIALPAGMFKMDFKKFFASTVFGAAVWSGLLVSIGWFAGTKWEVVHEYVSRFAWVVVLVLAVAFVWWVWRHVRRGAPSADSVDT